MSRKNRHKKIKSEKTTAPEAGIAPATPPPAASSTSSDTMSTTRAEVIIPEVTTPARPSRLSKRRRKSPQAKLISPWVLFKYSLHDLRRNWAHYLKIIAFTTLPADILLLAITDPSLNTLLGTIPPFLMNVALLWSITQYKKTGTRPTVAQSYYEGSSIIVRFVLVNFTIIAALIPATFGILIYILGTAYFGTSSGLIEQIVLIVLMLLFFALTVFLLVRITFAVFGVAQDDLRPIASIRRSIRYTAGRFWPVAGRLAMLLLFLALVSIPTTILSALVALLGLAPLAALLFEVIGTLVAFPLSTNYLLRLYNELGDHGRVAATEAIAQSISTAPPEQTPADEPPATLEDEPIGDTDNEPVANASSDDPTDEAATKTDGDAK